MQFRDIFLLAMERQDLPRVPFVETSIAFGFGEKILGRKLRPVEIPQLSIRIRNVKDEKDLARKLSIGFTTMKEALYANHELIDAVMTAYVNWFAHVIRRVIDMGVDCIKTTDDFAFSTGPFISPEMFRTWVLAYHRKAHAEINVPWILHTDRNIDLLLEDLFVLPFSALHPIDPNCYDIRAFIRRHGHRKVIIGNVNLNNLGMGTPDSVEEENKGLLRDLGPAAAGVFQPAIRFPIMFNLKTCYGWLKPSADTAAARFKSKNKM